jgi:hypothetical protein
LGQLADFYAGEPSVIGDAFSAQDFETLGDRGRIPLHVDFSLQLSPLSFDSLTASVRDVVGAGPTSFTDALDGQVGGDGDACSADTMSPAWVEMVAAVPDDAMETLMRNWIAALRDEYGDTSLSVTDDMNAAVRALVGLCRDATERNLSVVHTWSL